MKEFSADPDFSQSMIDDLYRYKFKLLPVARLLVVFLGIFGAHRFYLGKTFTATLMILSVGGGLIWWLIDIFLIKKMLMNFNIEEQKRKNTGEAPQGFDFLPSKKRLKLKEPPAWSPYRRSIGRVYGSFFLLSLVGFILGIVSGSTGTYEPTIILLIFIIASLLAAHWQYALNIPLLSSLIRWVHRLRLFYYSVDPGNIWLLAFRPIYGIFTAPIDKKSRAELRLYVELGLVFSILFFCHGSR